MAIAFILKFLMGISAECLNARVSQCNPWDHIFFFLIWISNSNIFKSTFPNKDLKLFSESLSKRTIGKEIGRKHHDNVIQMCERIQPYLSLFVYYTYQTFRTNATKWTVYMLFQAIFLNFRNYKLQFSMTEIQKTKKSGADIFHTNMEEKVCK